MLQVEADVTYRGRSLPAWELYHQPPQFSVLWLA